MTPIVFFGALLLIAAVPFLRIPMAGELPPLQVLIMPAVLGVAGYFFMRVYLFNVADEVLDDGDALIIRKGSQEQRVALSDIVNVGYSQMLNPPRVTLSLRTPGVFGAKVTFWTHMQFLPFSPSPIVDELIRRVDATRSVQRP
jgi:hypothetical protein